MKGPTSAEVAGHLTGCDLYKAKMYVVAEAFGVSINTLSRRLSESGTTYCALIDEERGRRIAAELERNPGATCHELAKVSNFQDHQSLCRAMTRLFGSSLTEIKRRGGI